MRGPHSSDEVQVTKRRYLPVHSYAFCLALTLVIITTLVVDFPEKRKDFLLFAMFDVFLQRRCHGFSFSPVSRLFLSLFQQMVVNCEIGWHCTLSCVAFYT